jgi:hypothetical protein
MKRRFKADSSRKIRTSRLAFGVTAVGAAMLLGTQSYLQQIFYGAALIAAIPIPKATRDRFFKRKRTA